MPINSLLEPCFGSGCTVFLFLPMNQCDVHLPVRAEISIVTIRVKQ